MWSRNYKERNKALSYWEMLEPRIIEFQDAFKEEQLSQLRLRRKM